jgi:phosphate transport system substrate-binding protein
VDRHCRQAHAYELAPALARMVSQPGGGVLVRLLAAICVLLILTGPSRAGAAEPEPVVSGTLRIWGHGSLEGDHLGPLVSAWQEGFRQRYPGVTIVATLRGDNTAIGGLYTRAADIALMERSPTAIELDAYQPIFKHDPFEISIATGSLTAHQHASALAVFVHRDNPLSRLTLAQLDAVFGADHRRGTRNVHTWGELGLSGAWAKKIINVYVPALAGEQAQHFGKIVLKGSQKWTGNLHEFDTPKDESSGRRVLAALAADRFGIALSTLEFPHPRAKPLALAAEAQGPYVAPGQKSVADRSYPLARPVSFFINRQPGQAIEPTLKEFLRYVLSEDGQLAIARDGGYFPLPSALLRQEREKLE